MKRLLSERRFELAALIVALVLALTHQVWVGTPVVGFGHVLQEGESAGLAQTFLRGIHSAEGRLTDLQFRLRGARAPHPDVRGGGDRRAQREAVRPVAVVAARWSPRASAGCTKRERAPSAWT